MSHLSLFFHKSHSPTRLSPSAPLQVDTSEAAGARCFKWSAGALTPHSSVVLELKHAEGSLSTPPSAAAAESQLLQMAVCYRTALGKRRMRVTTLALPRVAGASPRQLLAGLDQQAAAALLMRQVVDKTESGVNTEEVMPSPPGAHPAAAT